MKLKHAMKFITDDTKPDLLSSQKMFIIYLVHMMNETGKDSVRLSAKQCGAFMDLGYRTVQRIVKNLEVKGHITIKRSKSRGVHSSNVYKVVGYEREVEGE